jgi:hypothetical protein
LSLISTVRALVRGRGTAIDAPPDTVSPQRRRLLEREGRLDGRRRQPEPRLLSCATSTHVRDELVAGLCKREAEIGFLVHRDVAEWERDRRDTRSRIDRLEADLATARTVLAEVTTRVPDPAAAPPRRYGEQERAQALVKERRQNEYDREFDTAHRRVAGLAAELADARGQLAALAERIAARPRTGYHELLRLRATTTEELAIYQKSLIRRHPDGERLRPLLDTSMPELPGWATAPAAEAEERNGANP